MKIAVGMSGGVDSSVAALILKQQGHDVIGITMSIWDGSFAYTHSGKNACYGPDEKDDIEAARQICSQLDIPFYVIDCSGEYKNTVIEYFRNEYLNARTPNPCIVCNQKIKFGNLLTTAKAAGLDFDKFATGHYAKIEHHEETDRFLLKRGIDIHKDQSYFIYKLSQQQLAGTLLPLGDMTKSEVRELARSAGLTVSDKEESQDFYSGDYRELLNVTNTDGEIVDMSGRIIGRHNGIWNYTPGQRRGLGIAASEPLYVVRLESSSNRVVAGTKRDICGSSFFVKDINWIALHKVSKSFKASVKTRSTQTGDDAVIELINSFYVKVTLTNSSKSISPGQSAVFYDGDTVIGGGIIEQENRI
ncbi:MAG: tRNA 2-thiouridine(34) synthase MnmA [Spirochaetae bacterium HGW-Spirochaetae-5]|nr:MAG: tRNA 2-thiouridine(34) synthase MnmA [Spirochaetae bacterium HGW-Spirochaetae-5]